MGGGSDPTPAVTTQTIGKDNLTQQLAAQLRGQARGGNEALVNAVNGIRGSASGRGLSDPSVGYLRQVIQGDFSNPDALAGEIEAAAGPALRQFQRSIAPSIAGRFAAAGRSSSGAERAAYQDAQDIVSRNIAEVAQGAVSTERGRQLQAAGLFPQIEQADINRTLQEFQVKQNPLDRLLKISSALPALRTTTQSGGSPGSQSKAGELAPIAGAVVGTAIAPGVGTALGAGAGQAAGSEVS